MKSMREYHRQRYRYIKSKMIATLGGKCAECKAATDLEIDHIDPALKKFNPSKLWSAKWEVIAKELEKCQLLCLICHKRKHAPRHGTISGYRNMHCRCEPCRKAWNEACAVYKATYRVSHPVMSQTQKDAARLRFDRWIANPENRDARNLKRRLAYANAHRNP
jgi:hypothetical protein